MKTFNIFIALLIVALPAWADMEHKDGHELGPSSSQMSFNRSCFKEAEALGCGHPREDKDRFATCVSDQRTDLSTACSQMLGKLYLP